MPTIQPLRLLMLLGALGLLQVTSAFAGGDKRPNVIVILTDDQGYGDIGAHGNPFIKTPKLDHLRDESIRFTDFHVDPTCSPTRAALLTGRYSSRTGVWLTYAGRHHLRRDEVTMADVFRQNGYKTGIFGKWHLGDNYPFRPTDRGFDESLVHGGGVVGESPDYWGNDYYDDTYFRNGKPQSVKGYSTDVWFDEAIRFITRYRNRPFFVYLSTNTPHGPHHVPVRYVEPYLVRSDIPRERARFYGMISNIDENVGRLRARLAALGLSENTILIFLTDNGGTVGARLRRKPQPGMRNMTIDGFNAGMRGKKGTVYEGGHRAACFVHWPEVELRDGLDVSQPTAHIDLLPTLIEWCNLTPPAGVAFDGRSLAPLVRGEPWPDRTLVVHHQGRFGSPVGEGLPVKYKNFAVLTRHWRMVGNELFDYKVDPGQLHNIAPERPDVFVDLTESYERWWSHISGRFDEHTPFVIDPAKQWTTTLTAQNWYGEVVPYNQQHIRAAMHANGSWVIVVDQPGEYEVELRRWPRELNLAIRETWEHGLTDASRFDVKSTLLALPSKSIDAKVARLVIGDFDCAKVVRARDRAVIFRVNLKAGEQRVQSWFTTSSGKEYGAYYVYIEPARS